MPNIVIINQPLGNRGDEAAHRSLLRALDKNIEQSQITVLFLNNKNEMIHEFSVKSPKISYRNIIGFTKGAGFLLRWSLRLNMAYISLLHPTLRKYAKYIKKADVVICAPGGICMGGYQDLGHIYNLSLAKYYNKKLVYYSRSFGPFPTATKWNLIFKNISYKLLSYFAFLSIRDKKTMELADKLNLQYIPSIDTAFLDTPAVELPDEISCIVNNEKFIVFVPNSLTWHFAYKNKKQEGIDLFFIEIFRILLKRNVKVLMLPQLSKYANDSDYNYFQRLKTLVNSNNVVVLPDTYSSDIQQKIIEKVDFVIGARYHSIVFAINNCTPFISLSYEHKMSGLLELLNLSDREIDISKIGEENFDKELALRKIEQLLDQDYSQAEEVKEKVHKIAMETFGKLKEFINSLSKA